MNFKLKNYFLHNVLTPQMYLEDIYLNNNHPEHQNLKEDLDILEEEDVLKYYKKHETQINFLNKISNFSEDGQQLGSGIFNLPVAVTTVQLQLLCNQLLEQR